MIKYLINNLFNKTENIIFTKAVLSFPYKHVGHEPRASGQKRAPDNRNHNFKL